MEPQSHRQGLATIKRFLATTPGTALHGTEIIIANIGLGASSVPNLAVHLPGIGSHFNEVKAAMTLKVEKKRRNQTERKVGRDFSRHHQRMAARRQSRDCVQVIRVAKPDASTKQGGDAEKPQ